MSELRRWLLAAGLAVTVAAMGCGSDSEPGDDGGAEAEAEAEAEGEPEPDAGPPPPAPNIGEWCDPALSDGEGNNATCVGGARCMGFNEGTGAATNGMCVVYGCRVEIFATQEVEENCRALYGLAFRCVDLDGLGTDTENDLPSGQNSDTTDNVCVPTCVPSGTDNPCNDPFACAAFTTFYGWPNAVCMALACTSDEDCPVDTGAGSCFVDNDCSGVDEFCALNEDTNGDDVYDTGFCALGGNCDTNTGTCKKHPHGNPAAAIGDPCATDLDCPVGGVCFEEETDTDDLSRTQTLVRNGYCSMSGCKFAAATGAGCPLGSACNNGYFAGACFDTCDPEDEATCRDNAVRCDASAVPPVVENCDWFGDFDCYDRSNWSYGGGVQSVTGDPRICEFVTTRDCAQISEVSQSGCDGLAPAGDPAGMACRDRESGAELDPDAPEGRCLDTTGSGDYCSNYGSFNSNDVCVP